MAAKTLPVYLDTCVVLAAHRSQCWNALAGHFNLHTTQVCRQELTRGNPQDPKYVRVDMAAFDRRVAVHQTSQVQLIEATLRSPTLSAVDAGEMDLLAWCADQPDALLLSTGDRAAVLAACRLGLRERLVSLEELANRAGLRPRLPRHFTKAWLAEVCSEFLLEEI